MSKLFSEHTIRAVKFKNRLVVSPMCMYSSEDGFATNFHLTHLGSRAVGGFGLILQEATAVAPEGRITSRDLGIWKDEHIEKLSEIVEHVHSYGSKIGIQLAHAGRKASTRPPFEGRGVVPPSDKNGWETVAPSPLSYAESEIVPHELSLEEIEHIKQDFVEATRRAKKAGYDVVEIHAAHGYLLHQFYSPASNQRTDKYGGSFENRIRLLVEITELVRAEWGHKKPLFVRISATDWKEGMWDIEDAINLAKVVKEKDVDLIDTSSGGNIPHTKIDVFEGYQVEFAAQIKIKAGIEVGAVGLITNPNYAEQILQEEKTDLVFIGREALWNPYFPLHAAQQLGEKTAWPKQYFWAVKNRMRSIP